MKYIKLFNESGENESKYIINWELINDAKEMALEYIDEGYIFYLEVKEVTSKKYGTKKCIYMIEYSHDINNEMMGDEHCSRNLEYYIELLYSGDDTWRYFSGENREERCLELYDRLCSAYPYEIITM